MNRRDLLKLGALGGAASLLPRSAEAIFTPPSKGPAAPKPLRIAQITDIHILPGEKPRKGFSAALEKIYSMRSRPEIILIGGDCIMDGIASKTDNVQKMWAEWHAIGKDFHEIPAYPVLGNHDYHWRETPTGDDLAQRIEGAKWALDELKLKERYSTFDRQGWRFIQLDSCSWKDRHYKGELDPAQKEWLVATLKTTPKAMPVVVQSHISIFSACGFLEESAHKDGAFVIPDSWMHADALEIKKAFMEHGNVRLALSGHMHQLDDITLSGTRYFCAGSVCGNWWITPKYYDTPAGFSIIDLNPNGESKIDYVTY